MNEPQEQHRESRKAKRFEVIMATPDGGEETHEISLVWKDRLDGEREGAALMLNQDGLDQHKATLAWHAAMVRLGHFSGGFYQFVDAVIDVNVAPGSKASTEVELDPTQPAAHAGSA